ncbi:MAG: outer membrane protein assembly factor BamD [Saprospiraceae bacterium]|nr:outer membrane protein assembly factor BamD [Saprospiraceae bacterium]
MRIGIFLLALVLFQLVSCKSAYEKVRTSGDPVLIHKTANNLFQKKDYQKALPLYESIISNYRGQKEAEEIFYRYAQCQFYLSDYEAASLYFKNFASTFVLSSLKEEAEFMSVYSLYKQSPVYRLDQTPTEKAIEGFQSFVNQYPESSRVEECNKLIDELRAKLEKKTFEQALLYFDLKSYQACLTTLENLLIDFPDTKNEREVRWLAIRASSVWADNSIFEKQKERYLQTIDKCNLFLKKFPSGKMAAEVKEIRNMVIKKSKNKLYDGY